MNEAVPEASAIGQTAGPPSRAAFAFIFITVLLDMLAIGIIIPVLPGLIVRFTDGDTAGAAEILGLFGTAWALMQFLCSPLLGALSDRFGRRPVILISNVGLGLDCMLMAVAPSLSWLFIGRIISGISAASISTAFAYVADVTPAEQRAARFGMLGVAFGAGFVFGPAIGGLAGSIDPRLPFWIAAALSLANALYGWLILPESLSNARRMPFAWRRANPLGSLKLLRSHHELFGLASVNFLDYLAHAVLPNMAVLYMLYRYGWDERAVGFVLAGVGVCSMVVQGGLIGPVVKQFGERRALMAGLLFGAAGFFVYGIATTGLIFLIGVPLMALWGFANASALGLMSRHVGADEQGQLQGANQSLQGIANMFGPGLFAYSFSLAIRPELGFQLPGAPFLLAALLVAIAAVIAWRVTRTRPAASR
ncbi:MAG: transporter, family, tetracycline resistance protein [Hyphomicrobiales bacterium]|jgi:DHA1 family tetracycline resistance protein-like MFS transporter